MIECLPMILDVLLRNSFGLSCGRSNEFQEAKMKANDAENGIDFHLESGRLTYATPIQYSVCQQCLDVTVIRF